MTTEDLYTATDVKKIREKLLEEQDGKCAVLNIQIRPERTPVLDHQHDDEQFVRGVLEREVNAFLGTSENAYKRFLGYWCSIPLPDVLRACAAYLERPSDTRYRHPDHLKKLKTKFNSLSSKQMKQVLNHFGKPDGKNLIERKKIFAGIVLDRSLGYDKIKEILDKAKADNNDST